MKKSVLRFLLSVLAAALFLSACAAEPTPTDPAVTTEPVASTTVPTEPVVTTDPPATETIPEAPIVPPVISDLSVGFGRVDISPTESVPLRGYGNTSNRMSTAIMDPLYASCIALKDADGNTILLFALDLTNSYTDIITSARKMISSATGIPVECIMTSASHNHSSPDMENTKQMSIIRYGMQLKNWMLEAAQLALEDLAPAKLHIGSAETKNLNFVRRYVLQNGTYAGDNYGDFNSSPIASHESEVDNELQIIRFERGRYKDIILANFQTHPHREGGSKKTHVTADIIAPFRSRMERNLDCYFAYFTGGSGNVNPTSRISSENVTASYLSHGYALADYAMEAYNNLVEGDTGTVQVTKTVYKGMVNHAEDHLLPLAKEIQKVWSTTGNYGKCVEMGREAGINSPYHAGAIVSRTKMPNYYSFDIYALSIGDVAFVAVPFEMFDSNGMEVKEGSPFDMTFVLTCANENRGYLPSALAWEHGGYSVDTTRYAEGTAEELVANYLNMLNELYSTK